MVLPDIKEARKLRVALGLSQKELANLAGVSQSLIAKIESGSTEPSYQNMKRIYEVLQSEMQRKEPELLVGDICTKRLVYVKPGTPASQAKRLMLEHNISQVPVIEDGVSVGSVRESSILDYIGQKSSKDLSQIPVSELIGESFPQVDESTSIRLVRLLLQYGPAVLTTKKGKVTGIITKADLLKVI
jgi:predicted transcriptional regulator